MKPWRIITKFWNDDQYVSIDDLSDYLERELDNENNPEVKLFLNHLLNQLLLAKLSQ